jgi:protein gp37
MNKTSIEWTHRPETRGAAGGMTWNPIRARLKGQGPKVRSGTFCTRISPGCQHCYASTINKRFGNGLEFTVPNLEKVEFFIDERILQEPLKQKKPCTIFVGDMFDLFHEAIPEEMVGHVFAVMAQCQQHTFQVLTKRADEMYDLLSHADARFGPLDVWPLPHVWCGVSVENNKRAAQRIPHLQNTPAVVRFLSVEPQLEDIDFEPESIDGMPSVNMLRGADWGDPPIPGIDWVICGGESGPGARPFNLAWAESLLAQCRAANVPFFMKQIGSNPRSEQPDRLPIQWNAGSRKGGDPSEWPESLRVREFPVARDREEVTT